MPPPMLSRLVLPLELSREAQEGFGGQRPTSGLRPRPLQWITGIKKPSH